MRAAILVLALLWLMPATARAGTYEVWGCADADGHPIAADGWASEGAVAGSSASNQCAAGQGLYAVLSAKFDLPANQSTLSWHFKAPADTRVASYRLWRWAFASVGSEGAPMYILYQGQIQFDDSHIGDICSQYERCASRGTTAAPFGGANLVTSRPLGEVRDLWMNIGCGGAGTCRKNEAPGDWATGYRLYRSAIVLQDDTDPVFGAPPAGSLFAGGTLTGSHGVSFSATDTGSGVQQATLEVDGRPAATQTLGCAPPYTATVPCKLSSSGTVTLDTAALTDGPHAVRLLLSDASGNSAAYGPFTVTTSNAPSACAPAAAAEVVTTRRTATIAYGARLNLRGTVAGAAAGTVVRVISEIKGSRAPRLLATPLTTDARGRFSYRVPAGPSRTLRFAYRSGAVLRCSRPLTVSVRARVSLRASPRTVASGSRVRFSGRLRGGHVPRSGKVVELQAFERGRWRTFRTVRSSSRGVFRYRYRFSFRASGVTFPVRARVRADAGYPFALGTSNRVRVRVR